MCRTAALRIALGILSLLAISAAQCILAQTPAEPSPRRTAGKSDSAKAGRTIDLPRGQWTDVLKLVELKKRSAVGPWCSKEKTLVLEDPESPARAVIPVAPGGSYDLKIEFTRTDGDGTVGVILPVGARQCLAALNYKGGPSGLDMIDGHHANDNASTAPGALSNDRRYRLEINVRPDGSEAAITVALDDRTLFFYRGPTASLALAKDWAIPGRAALGLGGEASIVFHTVQLRINSGTARTVP